MEFIIFYALIVISVIVFVISFITKAISKSISKSSGVDKNMQAFRGLEDFLSQALYLLGLAFIGLTVYVLFKKINIQAELKDIILLCSIIGLAWGYFQKSLIVVMAAVISFVVWNLLQIDSWNVGHNSGLIIWAYLPALMAVMIVVGKLHFFRKGFQRLSLAYRVLGHAVSLVIVFVISSYSMFGELFRNYTLVPSPGLFIFFLCAFGVVIVCCLSLVTVFRVKPYEVLPPVLASLLVLFVGFSFSSGSLMTYINYTNVLTSPGMFVLILLNLLNFLYVISFIIKGYQERNTLLINLGTGLSVVFVVVKYVDAWGFVGKSVGLILGGILFLALAYFATKGRMYLIKSSTTV